MPKVADSDKSKMEKDTKPLVPKAKPKAGKVVKTTLKSSMKPKKPAKPQKPPKKKAKKPVKQNKSTKKNPKKKPKYESTSSDSNSDSYSESDSDSDSMSSSSSSDSDYHNSNVKSSRDDSAVISPLPIKQEPELKRDIWMTDSTNLKMNTFTKERKTAFKPNAKQQIDSYDPSKNVNELNPYWKKNGTGLPAFKKPKTDNDDGPISSGYDYPNVCTKPATSSIGVSSTNNALSLKGSQHRETFNLSDTSGEEDVKQVQPLLTDEQINELAAKAIKAELKCDVKLAKQLNEQLLLARQMRAEYMASGKSAAEFMKSKRKTEHVLLTRTDASGNVRPLMPSVDRKMDANNQNKGPSTSGGQRNRYIITDDRYDIKMMFEREKHATAAESNLQYANILAKNKKPNDDLDGVFEDCVRMSIAEDNPEQREINAAIKEHQQTAAAMDNCKLCFDSAKMEKYLILSMGTKIYMTLPTNVGLQVDHCILTSMQHVSACTLLDEDAWEELTNYRIALTQMFAAQQKDVIFFEIANKLYKRQHLAVHCVPIPDSHGEMAPFFFKKAIEESEQEWSINKQLITLDRKPLCEAIPKGLPYFWVHFAMGRGFAHVIEDEERFPENFAQAIIGGMLGLNPHSWRKPGLERNIKEKVKTFVNVWKKYDFNEK